MSETLTKTLNRRTLVDLVAAHLYATSAIDDNVDITNIQFGELFGASETELVPLKIYTKKEVSSRDNG